jgi:hypothetical protein
MFEDIKFAKTTNKSNILACHGNNRIVFFFLMLGTAEFQSDVLFCDTLTVIFQIM